MKKHRGQAELPKYRAEGRKQACVRSLGLLGRYRFYSARRCCQEQSKKTDDDHRQAKYVRSDHVFAPRGHLCW
jgi:hypothetical protein